MPVWVTYIAIYTEVIITNRIKEVRQLMRVSQIELAKSVGVSQPFICDLENNRRGAKPETMTKIANVLGVTVADLEVA